MSSPHRWFKVGRCSLTVVLAGAALTALAAPASPQAATSAPVAMQVTTLSGAKSTDGACSLPEANANAITNSQAASTDCPAGGTARDTITFSVAGTIDAGVFSGSGADLVVDGGGHVTLTNSGRPSIVQHEGGTLRLAGLVLDGALSSATDLGGCVSSSGVTADAITIVDSTLTNCRANRWGGAIYAEGRSVVTLLRSTISHSSAGDLGAGILANGPSLRVMDSTIADTSEFAGAAAGGAIYSTIGSVQIVGSTITRNASYRAAVHLESGPLTVTNSTIAANGSSGLHPGGPSVITNSLLADNRGQTDANASELPAVVRNSIIATHAAQGVCVPLIDAGHNLDDDHCRWTSSTSRRVTDVGLDPTGLRSNGGPTQTVALCTAAGTPAGCIAPSPALDRGDPAACADSAGNDQRHLPRPADGDGDGTATCDIGPFEAWQSTPRPAAEDAPLPAADLSVTLTEQSIAHYVGGSVVWTASVRNAGTQATARGVMFSAVAPVGASVIVGTTTSQGTCRFESVNVYCPLGSLAAGATATVKMTVKPNVANDITLVAGAVADSPDDNGQNNLARDTAQISTVPTATTVTSSANPSWYLQPVTYTLRVAPTVATSRVAGGTVALWIDGKLRATLTLDAGGRATLTTATLAVGAHTVSAAYAGNAAFNASQSTALTQQVNRTGTTSQFAVTPLVPLAGQPIAFRVTVRANAGGGVPVGEVTLTFSRPASSITVGLVNGVAKLTRTLPAGPQTVTAHYAGTPGFFPSDTSGVFLVL